MKYIQAIRASFFSASDKVRYLFIALLALLTASPAFAQEGGSTAGSLSSAATSGMGGVVAAVVAILLLGIGVKVLFFSNSGIKKGIGAAK
jgi:hypothetical protein